MARILVTGASGMVGRHLCDALGKSLFCKEVYSLVRRSPSHAREIWWDPAAGRIDLARCENFDAVVHLAGENVGSGEGLLAFTGRWSAHKKHAILESRRQGTQLLARTLASLRAPPRVLVSASGVGYYGLQAGAVDESAPRGSGFLAEVAEAWEAGTAPAAAAGVRVVNLRFGVILSASGGVVEKLRLPFSLGLGGPIGPGTQWMPFVTLNDAVRAIQHAITDERLAGPVNVVSPQPATNADFVAALAGALHRPAFIPMPEFVVRAVFGEMGEETLLASQKAAPKKLADTGFTFEHPGIREACQQALLK